MRIDLTPELEAIVHRQIALGYSSVDDVIHEALLLIDESNKLKSEQLRAELEKGEQSGYPIPYSSELLDQIEQETLAELAAGNMEIDPNVWPESKTTA
ncbi:hypothetical protein WA1_17835 [Scytonema hofmannii PCC 7110]|uniref:CopG family transcriptional regulator n=1 Tax=Scytonema hofmannii PCC 7110 TaxID=128403 RepID=A0A139XB88_9CYAN|nr:type II toxin-antitoxin system ParD family antitoxin [Scytonema hofmannii]KYC41882.1 hypothetical protein WA1_17835 [Scytonema hofmannii PCC 7110]